MKELTMRWIRIFNRWTQKYVPWVKKLELLWTFFKCRNIIRVSIGVMLSTSLGLVLYKSESRDIKSKFYTEIWWPKRLTSDRKYFFTGYHFPTQITHNYFSNFILMYQLTFTETFLLFCLHLSKIHNYVSFFE